MYVSYIEPHMLSCSATARNATRKKKSFARYFDLVRSQKPGISHFSPLQDFRASWPGAAEGV